MKREEQKPDNPSAFPPSSFALEAQNNGFYEEKGMTLRDYFASKAMIGYMIGKDFPNIKTLGDMCKASYNLADAMLKQREL